MAKQLVWYKVSIWPSDIAAIDYLESRGYYMEPYGHWHYPKDRTDKKETPKERSALDYLFLEWDYCGP